MKTYTYCDGMSGKSIVRLTDEAARECSHSGSCDGDVAYWVTRVGWIADDATLRRFLGEYGAWDDLGEVDTGTLRSRALWIAAGDINERPEDYDADEDEGGAE